MLSSKQSQCFQSVIFNVISDKFLTTQFFELVIGSPNISKKTDFISSSVLIIDSFFRFIRLEILSSFSTIVFCSEIDGSGI